MKNKLRQYARYILLSLIALVFILPFVWIIISAFRPLGDIFKHMNKFSWRTFVPIPFTFENYVEVFTQEPMFRFIFNTLVVAATTTFFGLLINSMAAYALARMKFRGKKFVFSFIILTIMLPIEVMALPLYLLIRNLGWMDTYQGLIIPWIASGYFIFLLRQYFINIPKDMENAAKIDGCGYFGVFFKIILPNVAPPMITVGLLQFQHLWDSFLWPLIITNKEKMNVIQIAVASSTKENVTYWNHIFVICSVAILPTLLLFFIMQKYYVKGVLSSGIKE